MIEDNSSIKEFIKFIANKKENWVIAKFLLLSNYKKSLTVLYELNKLNPEFAKQIIKENFESITKELEFLKEDERLTGASNVSIKISELLDLEKKGRPVTLRIFNYCKVWIKPLLLEHRKP